MVYEGVRLRSTAVDRGRPKSQKYLGFCLLVLMDLEAQTLSELRFVYALSIRIGFGSRCYWNNGLFGQGRVDAWRFCSGQNRLRNRFFPPSKTWGCHEGRVLWNPHGILKIISNQKWTTLARSRPVARSIVCLISRRPEGVRSRELHHENRRETLLPAIWVRRLKS